MKKGLIFLALFSAFLSQISLAEKVELRSARQPFEVEVVIGEVGLTQLHYQVNSYEKREIIIEGKTYALLEKLRKESIIEEKGYPRLPRINRSLIIPDDGAMGYEIVSADYIEIENINIAPSKGHLPRTIDPKTVPYTFSEIYGKDEFFPSELVHLERPYILRDLRGMVVELNAFQYNPVKKILRIYTDVTLKVTKTASEGENTLIRHKPFSKMDPQFEKIYRRHFLNYDPADYPPLLESGGMLVISYDDFMDEMAPFVEWKNQKGIPTEMVPISQIGTNPNAIKQYILNYYNQNDLGYVLLVGDAPQVPTYFDDSDPVYSLLTGGDNYSEIFVGRFSAENGAQVATQVERTITYEEFPDPTGTWYSKGLGDADEDGPCNPEDYDYQHISNIAFDLLDWNYTQVDSVYTVYGGTTAMIMNRLNEGRSIFNYAGHGWINMVGPVNFTSTNANDLVNDNRLFHFVAVACQPGNFVDYTCLAEDLLRATNNVTGEPTGAIAVYLSRISQSWFPPYDMQDEGVDLLVADSMLTFGGMCFNGGMLMIDLFGAQGMNEYNAWTIFGDPSVYLRSTTPYELTVAHDPELPVGMANFDVTVMGPSGPMVGAMVCGMNNEIYATGITNSTGHITLTFSPAPTQTGTFTLTVTTSNAIPYIAEVNIVTLTGPYIAFGGCIIQDDISGNNNGQLDYGETVDLGIALNNIGTLASGNISAMLSTTDPLVTIVQDSAYFGQIPPDSSVMTERAFAIEASSQVEDNYPINFFITMTDGIQIWDDYFSLIAHAPDIVFSNLAVIDTSSGNGNGNLDPGETADLLVTLENSGSSPVDSIEVVLFCLDPYITINNAFSYCGNIPAGNETMAEYNVAVSPSCPTNYEVNFILYISGAISFADTAEFSAIISDLQYLPTGPDNYGYTAYDIHDAPEFPVYNWIEISPDSGGNGTLVPFVNDDQVLHFALPFEFRYYGEEYDSLTISSDGWLSMGICPTPDYSNSGIPNSDGPPAMIAPYWEDMSPQRPNSGGVWQYYDDINNYYIVEFNHIEQFAPLGNFETFQIILYDPAYYFTITGDGRIKMQYKNMSSVAQTEGTIGIENQSETDGIQYLFDGIYDIHASPITNNMALIYTTPTSAPLVNISLTPVNPPIIIQPGGGTFNYSLLIQNNGTAQSIFDAWIEAVLPDSTVYGPILSRNNLTLAPGGSINRNMTQNVPGSAPAGEYIYRGNVGLFPSVIYSTDEFPFTKLGIDFGSANTGWELTGWEEVNQFAFLAIPEDYYLAQNFPNPFNPLTEIAFGLPKNCQLEIKVFDILGREVAVLYNGWMNAGEHTISFDAGQLSSGIYFYSMKTDEFNCVKKMLLLK